MTRRMTTPSDPAYASAIVPISKPSSGVPAIVRRARQTAVFAAQVFFTAPSATSAPAPFAPSSDFLPGAGSEAASP